LIKQWNDFIKRPEVRGHVVFLSDYDMQMAQELVQGMDLWINTPRRPWEACGTSGMKVLANGGLNISELDGWWAEAYTPKVGWAIGDGKEHGEDAAWDAHEVETLYACWSNRSCPSSTTGTRRECRLDGLNASAKAWQRLLPSSRPAGQSVNIPTIVTSRPLPDISTRRE
jgi:starch phosphorylase